MPLPSRGDQLLGCDNPANCYAQNRLSRGSPYVQWLAALLFMVFTSAVSAFFFEYERYQSLFGLNAGLLSRWDKLAILSVLWAKSVVLFLPLLMGYGVLIRFTSGFVASFFLCAGSILLFYWIAVDLLVINVTGRHLAHWLPYVLDVVGAREENQVQVNWIKGWNVFRNASAALVGVTVAGVTTFLVLRRLSLALADTVSWLRSGRGLFIVTAGFLVVIFGAVPVLTTLSQPLVMRQIYPALPAIPDVLESITGATGDLLPRVVRMEEKETKGSVSESTFLKQVETGANAVYSRVRPELLKPKQADSRAVADKQSLPNVVLICLESFRHTAVSPKLMKRMDDWSKKGLRLEKHYSGSNCSHLGVFALLYGRTPLNYDQTVNAGIVPQICESLRNSGYRATFISSTEYRGFRLMGGFLNEKTFDKIRIEGTPESQFTDWPDLDRRVLDHVRDILATAQKPQFVFAFLMSTHYPYMFTQDYELYRPCAIELFVKNWKLMGGDQLYNRYKNAALFLENEVMKFIEELDPERNIVIITGDHGESMTEDGWVSHATRASEIQTRVPFMMVGPGIKPQTIRTATSHMDFVPTLLHELQGSHVDVACCQGRDLVANDPLRDETVLVPSTFFGPHELLLLQGDERLLFKLRLDRDTVKAAGFLDVYGRIAANFGTTFNPSDAERWIGFFGQEMNKIAAGARTTIAGPNQ